AILLKEFRSTLRHGCDWHHRRGSFALGTLRIRHTSCVHRIGPCSEALSFLLLIGFFYAARIAGCRANLTPRHLSPTSHPQTKWRSPGTTFRCNRRSELSPQLDTAQERITASINTLKKP